jgi:hypothetical protein
MHLPSCPCLYTNFVGIHIRASARQAAASRHRRCSSPTSCSFAFAGCEEGANPRWWDLDTPKVFRRPALTFGTGVNLPLTFAYVPFSGRRPRFGAPGDLEKPPKIVLL